MPVKQVHRDDKDFDAENPSLSVHVFLPFPLTTERLSLFGVIYPVPFMFQGFSPFTVFGGEYVTETPLVNFLGVFQEFLAEVSGRVWMNVFHGLSS